MLTPGLETDPLGPSSSSSNDGYAIWQLLVLIAGLTLLVAAAGGWYAKHKSGPPAAIPALPAPRSSKS